MTKKDELIRRTMQWVQIQSVIKEDLVKRLPLMLSSVIDAAAAHALSSAVEDHLKPAEMMNRAGLLLERSINALEALSKDYRR